jgi:hypothetical protein
VWGIYFWNERIDNSESIPVNQEKGEGEAFQATSLRIRDHARGRQAAALNSDTRRNVASITIKTKKTGN